MIKMTRNESVSPMRRSVTPTKTTKSHKQQEAPVLAQKSERSAMKKYATMSNLKSVSKAKPSDHKPSTAEAR